MQGYAAGRALCTRPVYFQTVSISLFAFGVDSIDMTVFHASWPAMWYEFGYAHYTISSWECLRFGGTSGGKRGEQRWTVFCFSKTKANPLYILSNTKFDL